MRIKFLMIGLLGLVSATTFAQKKELSNAQEAYEKYASLNGQKAAVIVNSANASLNDAKTSIDKAVANEKTATLPLTYALKGVIYAALALRDTVPATSTPLFVTADEAIKKAKELDTKGENKKWIDDAGLYMAQYKLNEGVKEYQNKNYDKAYSSFDYYRQLRPDGDTTSTFYTALAATNAGDKDPKYYPMALTNYSKLLTTNYSRNDQVYLDMSVIYLRSKDTSGALKIVTAGVAKYPTNSELRKREIEIALQMGKQNDILDKIQVALTNDPKNKTLNYYAGLTYSQIADADYDKGDKAKDPATKKALHQTALDNYAKAAEMYKKAVDIDPNYFEANLNLGYALIRPAIDAYYAASNLPGSQQKQYEAAIAKANAMFDVAKPYLEKAVELKPKSVDALTNLRSYYRGRTDPAHKAEYAAKAAELKKQIDDITAGK
jgi:hypothetical protein